MITTTSSNSSNPITHPYCLANTNMLWAATIGETLSRMGVTDAVLSPGSRVAPLVTGLTSNPKLNTHTILDERSASFFALGLARQTGKPVALACTSGTAAANYFPAIIEAHISKVPLIVLTADRPPENQFCHSEQTMDQQKLYGSYARFYQELAVPEKNPKLFSYLRQTVAHAAERALFPTPGPVHVNVPFRDPLAPLEEDSMDEILKAVNHENFFDHLAPPKHSIPTLENPQELVEELSKYKRGIIVVGPYQGSSPESFAEAVGVLSKKLGWPTLTDALGPLRNFKKLNPHLITHYDIIARNKSLCKELEPDVVLSIGRLPTSKPLRFWLEDLRAKTWILEPGTDNMDPFHRQALHLRTTTESFAQSFSSKEDAPTHAFTQAWEKYNQKAQEKITESLDWEEDLFEGKVAYLLSKNLPQDTPLFTNNSMPVRDLEYFWQTGDNKINLCCNRGVNGIDGVISTAFGIAQNNQPAVLICGDLAFLHDQSAHLISQILEGSLTIVLINNSGGRIFENLPIAPFKPFSEKSIMTPQDVSFEKLSDAYGFDYYNPKTWEEFTQLINPLPEKGVRLIEVVTDSNQDVPFRKNLLDSISQSLR